MIIPKIGITEERILERITDQISSELSRVGLFNRVFSRVKSEKSTLEKLIKKEQEYRANNKKMQDLFGIRVTVYFQDDEDIAVNLIKQLFQELPDGHSIDVNSNDQFGPQRRNLIFRFENEIASGSRILQEELIDSSFEVQFRTVLSEGWHEVEHDLRYKCKHEWENENILHRCLNGLLAGLETNSWAMLKIFDELAYKKYKEQDWTSFFRNTLRIRFEDSSLSEQIVSFLNSNPNIGKRLLKMDRLKMINSLRQLSTYIPLKMDNVLFVINRAILKNEDLYTLESLLLTELLDSSFPKIEKLIEQID